MCLLVGRHALLLEVGADFGDPACRRNQRYGYVNRGKGAIGGFCKVSHRASDIGGLLATRYLKTDRCRERVRQRRVGHDVEEPISVDVLRRDLVL